MATDGAARQAVVVIHGIGEQRPMQTLRAFVDTLLGAAPKPSWWARLSGGPHVEEQAPPRFHSKPDRLTDTLELRRLASGPPLQTDFYELYWAHLMEGTAWSHIVAWAGMLMCRLPIGVHPRVMLLWAASWILCAAVVYLAYVHQLPTSTSELLGYGAVGVLALALLRAFRGFGLRFVGDAARYLSPTPQNINARKNIRNAVIQLLAKLHDEEPMRYGASSSSATAWAASSPTMRSPTCGSSVTRSLPSHGRWISRRCRRFDRRPSGSTGPHPMTRHGNHSSTPTGSRSASC